MRTMGSLSQTTLKIGSVLGQAHIMMRGISKILALAKAAIWIGCRSVGTAAKILPRDMCKAENELTLSLVIPLKSCFTHAMFYLSMRPRISITGCRSVSIKLFFISVYFLFFISEFLLNISQSLRKTINSTTTSFFSSSSSSSSTTIPRGRIVVPTETCCFIKKMYK